MQVGEDFILSSSFVHRAFVTEKSAAVVSK